MVETDQFKMEGQTNMKDGAYMEISREVTNSVQDDKELYTKPKTLPLSVLGDENSNVREQVKSFRNKFKREPMSKEKKDKYDRLN